VATTPDHLPEDTAALKAALLETRAKLVGAEALIEHLQLVIAKMKREMFGPRSERSQRLLDQLELQLEELAAAAGEDDAKAAAAGVHCRASRGARRRGATFPPICRAGGLFIPGRRRARVVAAASSPRSGRMSPRRSMSSRGNGS
jgi:Transposase C of IS166 homeodomain